MTIRTNVGKGTGISVQGFDEVVAALRSMDYRKRQNVERKAARASMNKFKLAEKALWKAYPVKRSSVQWHKSKIKTYKSGRTKRIPRYSIRKETAKAVSVKVGTGRPKKRFGRGSSAGMGVGATYARVFLNYAKKGAGAAKMAHFLELGTKRTGAGKGALTDLYQREQPKMFQAFAKALSIWIHRPKATAKQVKRVI